MEINNDKLDVRLSGGPSYNESVLYSAKMRNLLVGVCSVLFVGSAFLWYYVLTAEADGYAGIAQAEGIACLITAVIVVAQILFLGYDDKFGRNLRNTWLIGMIASMLLFYLRHCQVLVMPESGAMGLYHAFQFLLFFLFPAFMSFIPVLIITFIAWVVMRLFGKLA